MLFLLPLAFSARWLDAAIDSVADIPVIMADKATRRVFIKAKVRPAIVPVSSTKASLSPLAP